MLTSQRTRSKGGTLLVVLILLAVLSVIAAAAVNLSGRERVNAGAKGKRDRLYACANAARLNIWAELARSGSGYFDSSSLPTTISLPDGTQLTAPAHYSSATSGTTVKDIVVKNSIGMPGGKKTDETNTFGGVMTGGSAYTVEARCTDSSGNELEVEFITGLAL